MAPSGKAYNVDWIWSFNSDVHVANHLDWFTSYHPFETKISVGLDGSITNIIMGVGDVALPVKTHAKKSGRDAHATLKLRDVLYMPNATCNVLGDLTRDGVKGVVDFGVGSGKLTCLTTGATVGLLDCTKLCRLRLSGQSPKQSSLDKDGFFIIRANWSSSERQRWEAHKRQLSDVTNDQNSTDKSPQSKVPPYTAEEKQWLQKNSKDEFHFLRMYGYSIYDEEQRAKGRLLVRALMDDEEEESTVGHTNGQDYDDEDSDDGSTFLRELEEIPESHFADYHFSAEELKFIKEGFSYSSNFLSSYGLKFYDDEDCKEGKAILRQLMRDE